MLAHMQPELEIVLTLNMMSATIGTSLWYFIHLSALLVM